VRTIFLLARRELGDGVRNRWVAGAVLLLGVLALTLSVIGSAPVGSVEVAPLTVSVANLASLSVYLLPLLALMLSFDAVAGGLERGTLGLLLAYPVARWQVLLGKLAGHALVLAIAVGLGYGAAGVVLAVGEGSTQGWQGYTRMMGTSWLLGVVFLSLGYLVSVSVRERATAVALAVAVWLVFVVLYDLALFGLLVTDEAQRLDAGTFSVLMLANPTDAYRMFNLSGLGEPGLITAATGLERHLDIWAASLLGSMTVWVIVPLSAAMALFARREI
jgi:Cu-processing system permease protein